MMIQKGSKNRVSARCFQRLHPAVDCLDMPAAPTSDPLEAQASGRGKTFCRDALKQMVQTQHITLGR